MTCLSEGEGSSAQAWEMLRRAGSDPLSSLGYRKRCLLEDFAQQRCLLPEYEFSWGPRSSLEISKMKVLGFVSRLHRNEPQYWIVQFCEALAEETDRARASPGEGCRFHEG